jgi:4-hydroxybenzoate polyprenyltransferase
MRVIATVIAVLSGLAVLAGYFLTPFIPALAAVQSQLLTAAMTLAGVAVLAGVFNLVSVHTEKVRRDRKNGIYSALLVLSLFLTLALGIALLPSHAIMQAVVESVILPVEAALMGILSISLLYAAIRLLRRRLDATSLFFLLSALLVLLGSATLPFIGSISLLGDASRWWSQILALGGMRGILIGVALGTLVTGLRVLFGADRPYGG